MENNITVNNTFYPQVWFAHNGEIFLHNIVFMDEYRPAIMPSDRPWGAEMDFNLVEQPGVELPRPAVGLQAGSHRDASSIIADARFLNPAAGDFRVAADSPALTLGFKNFPMNDFGVVSPRLKAIARQPIIPAIISVDTSGSPATPAPTGEVFGAKVRDISGLGDRSAYGLPDESGVVVLETPPASAARKSGLQSNDVIVSANGKPVRTMADLLGIAHAAKGVTLHLTIIRAQQKTPIDVAN